MPAVEQKLTKKQRKALAFRTRSKKSDDVNGIASKPETESAKRIALENEGHISDECRTPEVGQLQATDDDVESGEAELDSEAGDGVVHAPHPRKRKRDSDGDDKKRKKIKMDGDTSDVALQGKDKGKERFILFVGNLKYTTTVDAIKDHFSSCDPLPAVRLLTPKASATGKKSTKSKSKGCAFLEFDNRKALQQALKLHQSKLDGKTINVELTVGGGGKSEARLKKLRERNKDLNAQRLKKQGESDAKTNGEAKPQRPQRFSTTSGVGEAPKQKRTWSVGNVVSEGKSRSRRRPVKDRATGVNAIPVG